MSNYKQQSGMALVMALVMLTVLSMIAVSAIRATNSGIRIVGNMQVADEVEIAAQLGIESLLSNLSNFTTSGGTGIPSLYVDMNQDSVSDYKVVVATPKCVNTLSTDDDSTDVSGGSTINHYDVKATITDNRTGATTEIHQGVRIKLLEYQSCKYW
jgi:type II secretory pathway component PulK